MNAMLQKVVETPVNVEHIMVECLFLHMIQIPVQHFPQAYVSAILYHMVKTDATMLSPAIGIVVELLFRKIPEMDVEVVDLFCKAFSHFLSNFDFKWRWSNWDYVLEAAEDDPQRLFVAAVIERCVRLSYRDRVQKELPESFASLLPPLANHAIKFLGV